MESIKRVTQHLQTSENTNKESARKCISRALFVEVWPLSDPAKPSAGVGEALLNALPWLFIPDTLHYRAYVTRPVYRSLARTEATINPTSTPNPNKLKN